MIIDIPAGVLWGLFIVVLAFFITMSVILNYHWGHYGMNKTSQKVARVSYFFISAVLLTGMVFFIGLYSF
jgi:hypothetical protein